MKEIVSIENPTLKEWCKLKQKKYRDDTNKVLLEGIRLITEAEHRGVTFDAVCTNFYTDEEFNCPMYKLGNQAFNALSGTENSQGIIAIANMPKIEFELPKGNFLILDNISDPGNMGTIIRTAVACDFKEIYCINCVDYRNEKVLRSTMGTIFDCKIMNINIEQLSDFDKYKVFCADMEGENIFNIKNIPNQVGIIMGNEANGITPEVMKYCSNKLSLPMKNKVESLNVAVACGIMMYILTMR